MMESFQYVFQRVSMLSCPVSNIFNVGFVGFGHDLHREGICKFKGNVQERTLGIVQKGRGLDLHNL